MRAFGAMNEWGRAFGGDPDQQEASQALLAHGAGVLRSWAEKAGKEQLAEDIEAYGPIIASTVQTMQSPERQVEILRNRLAWAERMNLPPLMVGRIQAQLTAAESALARERESDLAAQKFRQLGKIGSYVGIGVGASLIILFLSRALRR